VATDSDYRIKLQVFEGPLDLLLFLIRKNELDIYDIPIESVTRQYIDALKAMQQLDLDVAGEFFVMAATLMEIKSRLLLPKGQHAVDPSLEDDEMDPRWELVHQLLQYKKFKEAAAQLNELSVTRQNLMERFVSELTLSEGERPLKGVDRIELWNAFNMILRRLAEKLVVGEIHDEQSTVADQMEWLLQRTQTEKSFIFTDLFPNGVTLRRLVATFLAVLELTRLKKLRVRQSEPFADIMVEAVVDVPAVPPILEPGSAAESGVPATADATIAPATTDAAPVAAVVAVEATDVPVSSAAPHATEPVVAAIEVPLAEPVAPVAIPEAASAPLAPESAAPAPIPEPNPVAEPAGAPSPEPVHSPTPEPPPAPVAEIPLETRTPPNTVTE
jgi:segregation and condensation protein A